MLNKSGMSGHLSVLFLISEGKLSVFQHLVWHKLSVFHRHPLSGWGSSLLFLICLVLLWCKLLVSDRSFFCLDGHVAYILNSINMVFYFGYPCVEPTMHSLDKVHLVTGYNPFLMLVYNLFMLLNPDGYFVEDFYI